jgi:hypothetical protein
LLSFFRLRIRDLFVGAGGDRDDNSPLINDVSVSGFPDDLGPAVERR